MSSRGVFDPNPRRWRVCDTKARPDATAMRCIADHPKALVMNHICQLANGCADRDLPDSGDVRLRLDTGDTFLRAETAVVRLA